MKLSDVLTDIGRPVAYYARLARALSGVNQALFLCQFAYWADKGHDADGWIYKTQDEIGEETGLSRREQESARRALRQLGVLEEHNARLEHRLYYRLNFTKLDEIWNEFVSEFKNHHPGKAKSATSEVAKAPYPNARNRHPGKAENAARIIDTENTSETTLENNSIEVFAKANTHGIQNSEIEKYSPLINIPQATSPPSTKTKDQWLATIWQAYPKRVGKAKALKAIDGALKRLRSGQDVPNDDFDASQAEEWLLARTRLYTSARDGCNEQFTPYPATWFAQSRYCDDPAEWEKQKQREAAERESRKNAGMPARVAYQNQRYNEYLQKRGVIPFG